MPLPRFEVPSGVIDGVNRIFYVSQPYKPGTVAVFLNGLLHERSLDDGWVETDPAYGQVTLKEAPRPASPSPLSYPDVVQIFYLDTSPFLPEQEKEQITGTLEDVSAIESATIGEVDLMVGMIDDTVIEVEGQLISVDELPALLQDAEDLYGIILECC